MIKLQLINADIIDDTDTVTPREGIIREWDTPLFRLLSPTHWRVLKNGDPHCLVQQATPITKFYLTVCYF